MQITQTEKTTTVDYKCIFCREQKSVEVPTPAYNRWRSGELIQVAMPNVPSGDREDRLIGVDAEVSRIAETVTPKHRAITNPSVP